MSSSKYNLNRYTLLYENCRYDRMTTDGTGSIADIATDQHMIDTSMYRSYATFRKDIISENLNTKINETYFDESTVSNSFYYTAIDASTKNFKTNNSFIFPGSVLNKNYACNGNLATLEDIFALYGYDYLIAYTNDRRDTNNAEIEAGTLDSSSLSKAEYYFDEYTSKNSDTYTDGSYTILSIGTVYKNYDAEDLEDTDSEYKLETVEYDGTYVPTVDEFLNGELYIVIQSGTLNPKKVYFNNTYLPSLFINDDKYYNKNNMYIINGLQGVTLCDVTNHSRIGTTISWEYPIIISNIKNIINYLTDTDANTTYNNLVLSKESSSEDPFISPLALTGLGISAENILLVPYARVTYTVNQTEFVAYDDPTTKKLCVSSVIAFNNILKSINEENTNSSESHVIASDYKDDTYTKVYFPGLLNNYTTDQILGDAAYDPIKLDIQFGLGIKLTGFTTAKPTEYEYAWYEITKETGTMPIWNIGSSTITFDSTKYTLLVFVQTYNTGYSDILKYYDIVIINPGTSIESGKSINGTIATANTFYFAKEGDDLEIDFYTLNFSEEAEGERIDDDKAYNGLSVSCPSDLNTNSKNGLYYNDATVTKIGTVSSPLLLGDEDFSHKFNMVLNNSESKKTSTTSYITNFPAVKSISLSEILDTIPIWNVDTSDITLSNDLYIVLIEYASPRSYWYCIKVPAGTITASSNVNGIIISSNQYVLFEHRGSMSSMTVRKQSSNGDTLILTGDDYTTLMNSNKNQSGTKYSGISDTNNSSNTEAIVYFETSTYYSNLVHYISEGDYVLYFNTASSKITKDNFDANHNYLLKTDALKSISIKNKAADITWSDDTTLMCVNVTSTTKSKISSSYSNYKLLLLTYEKDNTRFGRLYTYSQTCASLAQNHAYVLTDMYLKTSFDSNAQILANALQVCNGESNMTSSNFMTGSYPWGWNTGMNGTDECYAALLLYNPTTYNVVVISNSKSTYKYEYKLASYNDKGNIMTPLTKSGTFTYYERFTGEGKTNALEVINTDNNTLGTKYYGMTFEFA